MPGYAKPTSAISSSEVLVSSTATLNGGNLQDVIQEIDNEKISLTNSNGTITTQKVKFNEWENSDGVGVATAGVDGRLNIPLLYSLGSVIQTKFTRLDTAISVTTGTGGIEITDLRATITPKFNNSLILCFFQIHGEGASTHDYIYNVYKNGTKPTGTYAGFNNVTGDQNWSGISQALPYEGDYSSTPFTQTFMYFDIPGTTSTLTYAPGIRNSNGTSYVYYINRTVGSTGTNGHEVGVSMTVLMEIAQ